LQYCMKILVGVMDNKKISMDDVAQKANVSKATVSRILNDDFRISENTRDKVLKVIKELGYEKESYMLKRTIAIVGLYLNSTFALDILRAVESKCCDLGYNLIIRRVKKRETALSVIKKLTQSGISGIIWRGFLNETDVIDYLKKVSIPYVLVDSVIPESDSDSVISENNKAIDYVISNIYKANPTPISWVGVSFPKYPEYTTQMREDAYFNSIKKLNLSEDYFISNDNIEQSILSAMDLVNAGVRNFFCQHSAITEVLINTIEKNNFNLEDFYFGDFDLSPIHYNPAINSLTIIQQGYEMGKKAINILYAKQKTKSINGKYHHKDGVIELDPTYVANGVFKKL